MTRSFRLLQAVLCIAVPAAVCVSQTKPTFNNKQSASGSVPANIYAVDLNNDGIPDLIEDTARTPNGFNVQLGNGDGTFKAPVFHAVSDGSIAPTPMAVADFSNDGKADIAIALPGTNPAQVAVYLGNGDGTFQSPKYSTIPFPSGQTFNAAPIAAADFNRDGKIDLVGVAGTGNNQTVYVLEGDGSGGFNSPKAALNLPTYYQVQNMAIGDFDADAKADIALSASMTCSGCNTVIHTLFGDGNFGFADTTPYSTNNPVEISAGDLDSDGLSDLVAYDPSTQQMLVFYGQTDRVFASYSWTIPNVSANAQFANGWYGPFQVGDFNGDGHMDIAGYYLNNVRGGTDYEFRIFLGTANRGQFTDDTWFVPGSSLSAIPFGTPPVTMDANGDGLPDIVTNETPGASGNHTYPSTIVTALNTTAGGNWGGCTYPRLAEGIRLCSPSGSTTASQTFKASAVSFGQMRKIELWVDGRKLSENFHAWEHNVWFNFTGTFAAGSHRATLYAADVDNSLHEYVYAFTVASGCAAPSSYGVHVCSPANGSTVSSPVDVQAAAKVTGTLARMEVWVDGVKKFSETGSASFNTTMSLAAGSHRFDVYAVNTAGTKYESTVYVTVK